MIKEEEIITEDGYRLYTRSWIVEQPNATIYLHHGFGEHSNRYNLLFEKFGQAGFQVHAFDSRGHGISAKLNPKCPSGHMGTWQNVKADMETFIKHFDSPKDKFLVFKFGIKLQFAF